MFGLVLAYRISWKRCYQGCGFKFIKMMYSINYIHAYQWIKKSFASTLNYLKKIDMRKLKKAHKQIENELYALLAFPRHLWHIINYISM